MKLRNKKTGEIDDVSIVHSANKIKGVVEHEDGVQCLFAYTLEEFNEEWEDYEDYEEQKEYWSINEFGSLVHVSHTRENIYDKSRKNFGNYFETKEEAEKAVEKLKAWKRLKDDGFRFVGRDKPNFGEEFVIIASLPKDTLAIEVAKDLELLFGGGDED